MANLAGSPVVARVTGALGSAGLDTDPFAAVPLAEQPLARLIGDGGDNLGAALSSGGCDLNGDGFDDVIARRFAVVGHARPSPRGRAPRT